MKYEKNIAKNRSRNSIQKIIGKRERDPWNFENETEGDRIEFGSYLSYLEFNAIRWERKKEGGGERERKKENRNKRKRRKRSPRETDGF